MKYSFVLIAILTLTLVACKEDTHETDSNTVTSENVFYPYFYEYDSIPKVYVYRNITHGLEEQYHRVFGINDSQGKHIVVEFYTEDGRLTEAYNYNLDSLNLIDHMVVGRERVKHKATLSEDQLIPLTKESTTEFASNFPGIMDSTFFLHYVKRKFEKEQKMDVMGKETEAVVFADEILLKLYNPYQDLEDAKEGKAKYYFAKGYGLVEWHSEKKEAHYRLEKIISQKDFTELVNITK